MYLCDEIVVQEDVGRSSQHGIGRGILCLGLQEGVRGESRDSVVMELRTQVHQSYRHLQA